MASPERSSADLPFNLERVPLEGLRPANYNPRHLSDEAFDNLRDSLMTLRQVRPILVNPSGTIIAGHQRTRAMRALGWTHADVVRVPHAASYEEEVRFNQLHNAADVELSDLEARVNPDDLHVGEYRVARVLHANMRANGAPARAQVMKLVTKFGQWGTAVATPDGRVLVGAQYLAAVHGAGLPVVVYTIPEALAEAAVRAFGREYGQFSYDHLPRTTYAQTYAQMNRLRGNVKGPSKSTLYERVIAEGVVAPPRRVLDFGAGHGDYAKMLNANGHRITTYEPYERVPGKQAFNMRLIRSRAERVASELEQHGLYDAVVCDSVMNSVDSLEAHDDVLNTITALTRPGGTLAISGRRREFVDARLTGTKASDGRRYVTFIDEHGFEAIPHNGVWKYQKYHSEEQIAEINRKWFGGTGRLTRTTGSWQLIGMPCHTNLNDDEVRASIAREFDMLYPGGTRLGMNERLVAAWEVARDRSQPSP